MRLTMVSVCCCLFTVATVAQDSTARINLSGYIEVYYLYDFNKPADGNRPGFLYSHNRHNEFNLNLGYLKAALQTERVRANFALGAGTYMNANYTNEPGGLKNIVEANLGVKITRNADLWLDAGILPSHIGFETAVSKDCPTLTRSLAAENSPYYETGIKLSYTSPDKKWLVGGLLLNGWQRISRQNGNSKMSFGTQVQYTLPGKLLINYSSFAGHDKPDSISAFRLFHNIYGFFQLATNLQLTAGIDIGTEQKHNRQGHSTWLSPVAILKYNITGNWSVAGRVEYYADKNGVIVAGSFPDGFQTAGYSINTDHLLFKKIMVRLEGRLLRSKQPVFERRNLPAHNNFSIASSMAISF